jgi:hypothetical protein
MKNFTKRFGKGNYGERDGDGVMKLSVDFDEIWIREKTEYLTAAEIKKWKGTLDIFKLYWKNGKIQAFTIESYFTVDPISKI